MYVKINQMLYVIRMLPYKHMKKVFTKSAFGKLLIAGWMIFGIGCTEDESFDINQISGTWHCEETYNSEGESLNGYQMVFTPTGENTCTIKNFVEMATVSANVHDDWSISVPEQTIGSDTYWGSGTVNINKQTMRLTMSYRYGSKMVNITADCTKKK